MELSEAMRKGTELTQPTTQAFFREDSVTRKITHACALGACYIGVEGEYAKGRYLSDWLSERWPVLDEDMESPVTGEKHELSQVIFNLNDAHSWTREEIADWLESQGL